MTTESERNPPKSAKIFSRGAPPPPNPPRRRGEAEAPGGVRGGRSPPRENFGTFGGISLGFCSHLSRRFFSNCPNACDQAGESRHFLSDGIPPPDQPQRGTLRHQTRHVNLTPQMSAPGGSLAKARPGPQIPRLQHPLRQRNMSSISVSIVRRHARIACVLLIHM